ncbi:hypothetical protein [Chryseobacterium hagamense]|uniref:Glycosyl transferase n=1 Tax=Chryseobacterium hagamense TaxID=395935 RepID=A0A511YLU1_9FLAO|nr:hypothetical protein [Chryseobacterium hagamense]GEN76167.1 glycosyl transferase [Chryseobacterium hagamense]
MKILGIVVCYYPNVEELCYNINQYVDYVDKLIIWKNSPIIESEISPFANNNFNSKIIFMGNEDNEGIAHPLNIAREMLLSGNEKFTHLLTMDQDSIWENFEYYKEQILEFNQDLIFSPNINRELNSVNPFTIVNMCITSGAVFSKYTLIKIGLFNETYSVDCVDYAFSFEAKKNSINIIKINCASMKQNYGVLVNSKFFGFNIQNNSYSAKRLYFLARNCILLWRDYPKEVDADFKKIILKSYIFGKAVKILLLEKDKFSKIFSIFLGFFAGIVNNRTKRY